MSGAAKAPSPVAQKATKGKTIMPTNRKRRDVDVIIGGRNEWPIGMWPTGKDTPDGGRRTALFPTSHDYPTDGYYPSTGDANVSLCI